MFTFQALQLLLFLIPGFFSAILLNRLISRRPPRSDLSYLVEALVLSMIIYAVYALIAELTPLPDQPLVILDEKPFSYSFNGIALIILLSLSLILSITASAVVKSNRIMDFLNRHNISPKSLRYSIWEDAFYDNPRYIVIEFEDGRRLWGWPRYYSEGDQEKSLFIYNPRWIKDKANGKSEYVDAEYEYILLTSNEKIRNIGFLPEDYE